MTPHSGLNFLPRRNNLRLLQAGAFSAVIMCAVMVGVMFSSNGTRTATISDSTDAALASPVASSPVTIRPKAISENQVVSTFPAKESDTIQYYERETGKAFSVNLKTLKTSVLSDVRLPGFIRSYWLPYSSRVVSEFQEPGGISYRMFDYQTKTTTPIGNDITTLTASPDGRQIAYMKAADDASALFISDSDGAYPRKILTTRAQEVALDWPIKEGIAMASRRADRLGSDLSVVDLQGGLIVLMSDRKNLEYTWSGDGTRLLFSYYTAEQGVSLWYRDVGSGREFPLGLATSARKCAWHGNTLVITCGIPAKSSLGSDVPADRTSTIDDIVTLDMKNGTQTRVYAGVSTALIGVIEPLVSSSENYFVFTNLFDQRLYLLPL